MGGLFAIVGTKILAFELRLYRVDGIAAAIGAISLLSGTTSIIAGSADAARTGGRIYHFREGVERNERETLRVTIVAAGVSPLEGGFGAGVALAF